MDESSLCTFAAFELDLTTGELRRNGLVVPLERQPARLLVALVARAGALVPREELRRAVWPDDTHVDFNGGLNYCVRQLRMALGDDARQPRFIETVARQGYRFMARVERRREVGSRPSRVWKVAGGAALAAALVLTLFMETSGRNESHHRTAVAVARVVHDFMF